jgi:hypothetical protein
MFKAAKDAMTSKAALHFFNKEMARYGKLLDLSIDSRNKTVDVSCQLIGERDPITIHVDNYTIVADAGKNYLQASGFTCSRPWLQSLLTDFAQNKRIELPSWASSFL